MCIELEEETRAMKEEYEKLGISGRLFQFQLNGAIAILRSLGLTRSDVRRLADRYGRRV